MIDRERRGNGERGRKRRNRLTSHEGSISPRDGGIQLGGRGEAPRRGGRDRHRGSAEAPGVHIPRRAHNDL